MPRKKQTAPTPVRIEADLKQALIIKAEKKKLSLHGFIINRLKLAAR